MHDHDQHALPAQRAAEWLARLKQGRSYDKRMFLRWLRKSPENVGEALFATSTDIVLRQFFQNRNIRIEDLDLGSGNVIHVGERKQPPRINRGRPWAWAASVSASLACVAALMVIQPPLIGSLLHPNTYTTSVGEQRSIELADGSAVSINAESSVRVKFSEHERNVYLSDGQAMFSVAKDPRRPFRVHVGASIVQAIGTQFDVRRRANRINVAVVEGVVQVSSSAGTQDAPNALTKLPDLTRVAAGEAVSIINAGQISAPAPINVADVGAWRQRRLIFSDNTLAEIAEEFSRYNRTPRLNIQGDALRARRLSGVFDADSPEALLMYLRSDPTIALDHRGDEIFIRLRPIVVKPGSEDG